MFSRQHFLPFQFHKHHWDIEIAEYYAFHFLFNIANSTLNLFVPIYLLQLGYTLWEVVAYYCIYQLAFMIGMPFAGKLTQKLGVKRTIALRLPFVVLFYIALQQMTGSFGEDAPLFVSALFLRGFFSVASDVAANVFIAKHLLSKNSSGRNIAVSQILMVMAGVIAPLSGGLVAYFIGFDAVFNAGLVMVVMAGIPLLLTPDRYFKTAYSIKDLYITTTSKTDRNFILAEIGRVIPQTLLWIMWPVFLYSVVKNTANMGILISASALVSTIVAYHVGKKVDGKDPEEVLKKAAKGATGLFFLRAFSFNPWLLGIVDIANNILNPILQIPYDFYIYRMVKSHPNPVQMSNVKQVVTESIFTLGVLVLLLVTYLYPEPSATFFMVLFAVPAAFLLLMQMAAKIKVSATEEAEG